MELWPPESAATDEPDPRHYRDIRVTVLDTETGESRDSVNRSTWYWTEGDGGCDCNRDLLFNPLLHDGPGLCLGQKRYVITAAELLPGYTLDDFNEGYPLELLVKAGVKSPPPATAPAR